MMTNMKRLTKRTLSLLLALVMCLGLLNLSAFAAEDGHVHNEDGYTCTQAESTRELTCTHEHDGDCYVPGGPILDCQDAHHTADCFVPGEDVLVCEDDSEEHEHTEECYAPGEDVLVCEDEHHTEDCYVPGEDVLACTHEHTEACWTVTEGAWTCVAPKVEETTDEVEETAGGVHAFLDAVDAIEVPEEDLALPENAELADAFRAEVMYAYGLWEGLTEEEQELEAVDISFEELQNMVMILPEYASSVYAGSSAIVDPDYNPNGCVGKVTKFGGSITKAVGDPGFYKRRAIHDFYCPNCGWFFGRSEAKEYVNIQWQQSLDGVNDDNIIDEDSVSFMAGDLYGYQCLQMNFTGKNPGTTLVTLQYDVNFHTRWNSGYAACPACRTMTGVQQYDDTWYHYEDQFYVTVVGNETSDADSTHYFFIPADGTENGSIEFELTNIEPYYNGFYWCSVGNRGYTPTISYDGGAEQFVSVTKVRPVQNAPSYYTGYMLKISGLKATPEGTPVTVTVKYYDSDSVCQKWKTAELKIVVYEPETVTLKVGESVDLPLKQDVSDDPEPVFDTKNAQLATASYLNTGINPEVVDMSVVSGGYNVLGKKVGTDATVADYRYWMYQDGNDYAYLDTWYLDVTKFNVIPADSDTETPVTIVKEFDGLTADQIPADFALTYTITGCSTCGTQTDTLNKDDATVTNSDGMTRLVWDVDLPVAAHGTTTHRITFVESNADVANYKLALTGSTVTLEGLAVDPDAPEGAKPVITVTNTYEPGDDVYVLSYDGMGGTNCPATQVEKLVAESHTFQVAGNRNIPVNDGYTFLGWAWTENASKADFAYDSTTNTYTPAETTLTKAEPSKTLYAVWQGRPHVTPVNPKLTKLEKVRLTELPAGVTLPDDVTVNTDQNVLFVGDNAADVTLLYRITVTGTAGAKYKVTDAGAVWVSGGESHETKDGTLIITGTIAEGKTSADLYVTKTFTKADVVGGKLTNNATLASNDPVGSNPGKPTEGTEGPTDGSGSGSADASKKHTVTINFKTDENQQLRDPSVTEVDEGGDFNYGVEQSQTRSRAKAKAGSDVNAVVIPWRLGANGEYVLDTAASADGLKKLAEAKNITADVVADIIYSKDVKGTLGTDDDGNSTDTSDDIPDKYQAKVVYTVNGNGSQDGTDAYVTIMDADGKWMEAGTIAITGATAAANADSYFVNWTAAATGHDGWTYEAKTSETLAADSIPAKGNAVYTFTANFNEKTVLTIEITGNNDTVTANGAERSVSGYTAVVKDKDGQVIILPAGLTVTPSGAACVAKGTEARDEAYPMGLAQDQFALVGADAGKYTVTFTVTDGWLKINAPAPDPVLDVTAGGVTATYDGQEHPVTPVVTVDGKPVEDATVTVVYKDAEGNVITSAPVDAGEYTAEITVTVNGQEKTTTATVTISKRELTVTTESASKTYDGTALTAPGSVSGLVEGETVTLTVTGTQTQVGTSDNTGTLTWDGTAKEGNYEVKFELGTLTVNPDNSGGDDGDDPYVPPTPPSGGDDDDEPNTPPSGDNDDNEPGTPPSSGDEDSTPIEDENPPLADIPDEDAPLADLPKEQPPVEEPPAEEIPDEDVPLDAAPQTGDNSKTLLWAGLSGLSLLGIIALLGKKREENAE